MNTTTNIFSNNAQPPPNTPFSPHADRLVAKIPLLIHQLRTKYESERREIAFEVQEHLHSMRASQAEALDAQSFLMSSLEELTSRLDAMEGASIDPQSDMSTLFQQMAHLNKSLRACQEEQQLLKAAFFNDRLLYDEEYHKRLVQEEHLYLRIKQAEESSELLRSHLHRWRSVNTAVMENGRVLMQFVDDNHVRHGQQNLLKLQNDVLSELSNLKESHSELMKKMALLSGIVEKQENASEEQYIRDVERALASRQQQQKQSERAASSVFAPKKKEADAVVASTSSQPPPMTLHELQTQRRNSHLFNAAAAGFADAAASNDDADDAVAARNHTNAAPIASRSNSAAAVDGDLDRSPATIAGLSRIFPSNTPNQHQRVGEERAVAAVSGAQLARMNSSEFTPLNGRNAGNNTSSRQPSASTVTVPSRSVSAAWASSSTTTAFSSLQSKLEAFYTQYNPSKLSSIHEIMAEYKGAEEELMAALEVHYGAVGYFSNKKR